MHGSTLVSRDFTGRDEELNLVWVGGHFHVRKGLGPSRGADQPHEGEDDSHHKVLGNTKHRHTIKGGRQPSRSDLRDRRTHNERPPVVLAVLVLKEDVDDGGHEGVQEGKNSDGDEELCRGRVVSGQEDTFSPYPLTHGGFKGHLMQPETGEQEQGSRQEPPARGQRGCS